MSTKTYSLTLLLSLVDLYAKAFSVANLKNT